MDTAPTWPPRWSAPHPKPVKGTAKMERQLSRADIDRQEDKNKAQAKKRDGKCRLPFCPWCAAFKSQGPDHGAHVIHAKGMGSDPSLEVSQPEHLMRLCPLSHASQEKHEWAVEPLTDKGTDSICAYYIVRDLWHPETGERTTERVLWARELRIGVPDSVLPRAEWAPIRAAKEQD